MASDDGFDLGQLSESQQQALQQYTDVTGQEIKDAVPLLQRSQWNIQIAIAKFFDGEGPDLVAEAQAQQSQPAETRRVENLQESLFDDHFQQYTNRSSIAGRNGGRRGLDPAPRVVPQLPSVSQPPLILAAILAPLRLGGHLLSFMSRAFFCLFSFFPRSLFPRAMASYLQRWTSGGGSGGGGSLGGTRRAMLRPKETAERFRREFGEQYGDAAAEADLPFFQGGHAQALDKAKTDLKFLLTVLISPEHDDTDSFVRDTLLSPEVATFLKDPSNNIILWVGSVLDSEAYQVAEQYNCQKFPFSCVVCLTPKEGGSNSTRMSIVKRLVGSHTPAAYIAGIRAAMDRYGPDLNGVRHEREAAAMARNLRDEQDSAYERSLALDRERARQRREAAAAAEAAERRAREEAEQRERLKQQREQWIRWRAGVLREATAEPGPQVKEGVVRLALNFPVSKGGERIMRRFPASLKVEELYAFVECYDLLESEDIEDEKTPEKPEGYEHEYRFRIHSLMPREELEPSGEATLGQKMGRGGSLVVEDIVDEDEEDNEDGEMDGDGETAAAAPVDTRVDA